MINGPWADVEAMRNEGSGSSLTSRLWAGRVTLSVSRPAPHRKRGQFRPTSRALLNFLGETVVYCPVAVLPPPTS